jgi:thiol-disulfide isomerase/thioredoxin
MPSLQRASEAYAGKLAFLGVDTKDDVDSANDFLAATSVHYPQLLDNDGDLLHALGGSGLPVTVVLDAGGKVVYQRRGELRASDLAAATRAVGITS